MSYCIKLKSNQVIKETDLDSIMENLPEKYNFPINEYGLKTSKQKWGWSAICDITLAKNSISISGVYSISGNIAEEFSNYIKMQLKTKGYNISIDKSAF